MSEKWYVKNTAGKVFGPIDFESLKSWVRDGRVEPLAGISPDLRNWMLAPLKPELEMNWVVENNPGQFYGPTHRNVVDDLVKAGTLSPAARFFLDDRGAGAERQRQLESALAAREAAVAQKDVSLAEALKLSAKKDLQIAAVQKAVRERDDRISEAKVLLAQKDTQLSDYGKAVALKDGLLQQKEQDIDRRDAEIAALREEMLRQDQRIAELEELIAKRDEVHEREWETDVLVPEVVVNEMPPPVARQAFGLPSLAAASQNALADLERRAQQELARMGAAGAQKFFRRIKKK